MAVPNGYGQMAAKTTPIPIGSPLPPPFRGVREHQFALIKRPKTSGNGKSLGNGKNMEPSFAGKKPPLPLPSLPKKQVAKIYKNQSPTFLKRRFFSLLRKRIERPPLLIFCLSVKLNKTKGSQKRTFFFFGSEKPFLSHIASDRFDAISGRMDAVEAKLSKLDVLDDIVDILR